jgi:hypothetical protein
MAALNNYKLDIDYAKEAGMVKATIALVIAINANSLNPFARCLQRVSAKLRGQAAHWLGHGA